MTARVLLATSSDWPDGEPGHAVLEDALARRGVDSAWATWDDPAVDWAAAGLVAARSTWDYDVRLAEFLAWAEAVGPTLLNGAAVFRWNTDKSYLVELAGRVPVVPTTLAATVEEVRAAVEGYGASVVKPRVGAGGRGLSVVHDPAGWEPDGGPWVVQPLVPSVHTEGETSVFVLGGRPVSQVVKVAGPGDVRVHEHHGGRTSVVPLDHQVAGLATDAMAAAAGLLDTDLAYGRADLLLVEGRWCVSEVEVTEPGLYLTDLPENADAFADVVVERLGRGR